MSAQDSHALTLPAVLALRSGDLVLELAPACGGSVSAFYSPGQGDTARVDWLRPATDAALAAHDPLGMASFPLLPWCNRLRDGRAQSHGQDIRLPPNFPGSPHSIHGLAWQRPWQVDQRSDDSATLSFSYQPAKSSGASEPSSTPALEAAGWPWAFSAWQTFKLDANGLACQITLCNDSDSVMPFGMGHHPYFLHTAGTRLQCDLAEDAQMWEADADVLPTGLARPTFVSELRQGMELARLNLDNNFTAWQRRFRVDWPAPARHLTLTAASPLDFFVLYCPQGQPFFCAEPVSNCTDWLNWQTKVGPEAVGGGELAPGASCSSTFRLDVGRGLSRFRQKA